MKKGVKWENGDMIHIDGINFTLIQDVSTKEWYARLGQIRITRGMETPTDVVDYLAVPKYDIILTLICQCVDFVKNEVKSEKNNK